MMTLCVAAICESNRYIAMVADQKLTAEVSGDGIAIKIRFSHPKWTLMYAGIMSEVTAFLRKVDLQHSKTFTEEMVAGHLSGIYRQLMKAKWFSKTLEIIAAGYDTKGASVISIRAPGDAVFHSDVGFEAIGVGQFNARSMLYFHSCNKTGSLPLTIYRICEAKFFAEKLTDIGKETSLVIMDSDSAGPRREMLDVSKIRSAWESYGRPKDPPRIHKIVDSMLRDDCITTKTHL